ncbi:WhiB family transcription factor [Mycobacterium phage Mendokysei]|uniref:WhiB family transcription factor n=1 Tax=Mycobacterium phage Mendokysei TaxID=2099637 RepID=A0A2P1CGA4_9CAUD|nr:WhiB family transcription factor [Mycobacterium phage Mendokysei]AVJ50256.1 WhiB family transcription factor [Mycobacterium phage Mendokysei]
MARNTVGFLIDEDWAERALCAQTDPDAFFPDKGGSTKEAKAICAGCDVRDECLEYALAHDERFGIWGGLSERERRSIKRGRVAALGGHADDLDDDEGDDEDDEL